MTHNVGRYPNAYHEYMLSKIKSFEAKDASEFLNDFEILKNEIIGNPEMLRKNIGKGTNSMKYYKLIHNSYSCKNPLVLKINSKENNFIKDQLYEDIDLGCSSIIATSYYEKNDITIEDFIASNIGLPIVTERAKKEIEKLSIGNTDFIPVSVIDIALDDNLYAMHIRNHINADAINLNICKQIGESITVYGFHEEKVKGNDLFRIKGHSFSTFVSQNFVQIVKRNKLKGFSFGTVFTSD